jgi:predicted HicB family RNase H-like nuclease
MNAMSYGGYSARIDYDDEDGIFVGRIAGIQDGVTFHADTVADLKAAFHEAVDDYVETCAKIGKNPQRPYFGKVMFRISPDLHAKAVVAAEVAGTSLNEWAEKALAPAVEERTA